MYKMKVVINYTIYLGECKIEDYVTYIEQRHKEITKELGYDICCNTYGIHRNAERLHIHYHTINEFIVTEKKKIYKDKGLISKIKRLKTYEIHTLPYKEFVIPEVKLSVNYEDALDYDEKKVLAYPLKEYDTNEDMGKEVEEERCKGIGVKRLDDLRKYANSLYVKSKKQYEKQEKKKTNKDDLYSYLDKVVIKSNLYELEQDIQSLVRYVVKMMLMYYKENCKNFSIHQLKNQAVNYLYFSDVINENQICNYMNI